MKEKSRRLADWSSGRGGDDEREPRTPYGHRMYERRVEAVAEIGGRRRSDYGGRMVATPRADRQWCTTIAECYGATHCTLM